MGTMTFAEMVGELSFLLGNRTDPDTTDSTRVTRWLNQAYGYMSHPSVHKFRETQAVSNATTMATGTNEYSIATLDSDTVLAVRYVTHVVAASYTPTATKRKLRPWDIRRFEERTLSSGQPSRFAVDGSSLFIYPVPRSNENGQVLRIGYYKEIGSLGISGTLLPSYFDRPLMKFAHAFAEADLGQRARALVILREAQGLLNNAEEETELEAEDEGFEAPIITQSAMGI